MRNLHILALFYCTGSLVITRGHLKLHGVNNMYSSDHLGEVKVSHEKSHG